MTVKVLSCALVGSLLFAAAIQLAPAAPTTVTKTQSAYSWVYDPVTKETRTARSGVVAQGYMPLSKKGDKQPILDTEAGGDKVDYEEAASKKILAQGK